MFTDDAAITTSTEKYNKPKITGGSHTANVIFCSFLIVDSDVDPISLYLYGSIIFIGFIDQPLTCSVSNKLNFTNHYATMKLTYLYLTLNVSRLFIE